MIEVWKDVKSFEGKYQVSNLGRVRSLDRLTEMRKGENGKLFKKPIKGKLLTPQKDKCGYVHVRLVKKVDGVLKYILFKVHQLVAQEFLNYDRKNSQDLVIDHINGDKNDNRLENLEVVTRVQNLKRFWRSERAQLTKLRMRHKKQKRK